MKYYLLSLLAQISSNEINLPQGGAGKDEVASALRIVFGVAGGVAVLIVTLAGFKYVISQGNPQETAKAKDTILYALVGLLVIVMAFVIVSFVVGRL